MIKLALPGGSLRGEVAASLLKAGLPVEEYSQGSRSYRFRERGLLFRVFREPDIPIQVALGNYDLGLCRPAWVEELLWRYPGHEVVRLGSLGIGGEGLFVAAAPQSPLADGGLEALAGYLGLRIASEYPNLADAFALSARLPAYCIFPVWGAAEVYPPEDADLALVAAADEAGVEALGLVPLLRLFSGSCCLIAHRHSLREKDLGALLGTLLRIGSGYDGDGLTPPGPLPRQPGPLKSLPIDREEGLVRLALPDGHQQPHAMAALESAGLAPAGYGADGPRRLSGPLPYLQAKVIRPQDMPQHVALGSFDLAITGRDWLLEHLYQFPQSPAVEAADLGRGRYRLAAVASEEIPADTIDDALAVWRSRPQPLRLASEYAHIADHYARRHHLGHYEVIPISGASEGFVPEDADLLIEGAETGKTIVANRLKVIDTLFESTTCLIANREALVGPRGNALRGLIEGLKRAAPVAASQCAAAPPSRPAAGPSGASQGA